MATPDRDELHRLIDNLPDDTVQDLLVLARDRQEDEPPRRFPWAGIMHEAPDFALRARETMRADRRHFTVVRPAHCEALRLLPE